MSSVKLVSKLVKVKTELDEIMQLVSGSITGIQFKTIDDECEMEYLVDCMERNVKKLKEVINCSIPNVSNSYTYQTKMSTENETDVQKLDSGHDIRHDDDSDATLSEPESVNLDVSIGCIKIIFCRCSVQVCSIIQCNYCYCC